MLLNLCKINCKENRANFTNDEKKRTEEIQSANKCILNKKGQVAYTKIQNCYTAGLLVSKIGSWSTPSDGGNQKQGNNSPTITKNSATGQATVSGQTGSINCQSTGPETLDYNACKGFSDSAVDLELAHKAITVGENIYYQNKAMDTQFTATKNMANDPTAALKAQKSGFQDQASFYGTDGAIDAGKAAFLATKYSELPKLEDVKSTCNKLTSGTMLPFPKSDDKAEMPLVELPPTSCNILQTQNGGTNNQWNFLMNQGQRNVMMAKMVDLGVSALTKEGEAALAEKRASQVGDAINSVDNFQPVTAPNLEQAVTTTFCAQNPTSAKCTSTLPQDFSMIGTDGSNFGAGGIQVYGNNNSAATDATAGKTNATPNTTATPAEHAIGSVSPNNQQGGGVTAGQAATITDKPATPGGGGGGGGGPSGGGGGGGGGNVTPGTPGGTSLAVAGKVPSYGGGGFSILGGLGMKNAKKTADNGNPFGNMFDKKAAADNKSVSFRGPASTNVGNKGDDLFKMISDRYSWANQQKLMLEYEETK